MNGYLYLVFIKNIYEIVGWKMFVSFLKSIGHYLHCNIKHLEKSNN